MKNIMDTAPAVKSEIVPSPITLEWTLAPGTFPWGRNIKDGLGNVVAECTSSETAAFVRLAGNHLGPCRDTLRAAHATLEGILAGQVSIAETTDMLRRIEGTLAAAGGKF